MVSRARASALVAARALLCLALTACVAAAEPDRQVEALLADLSLDEKIGQMTQLNLGMLLANDAAGQAGEPDPARLREAIGKYHVGSIINAVPGAQPVAYWHRLHGLIDAEVQRTPHRVPVLYGIDAIHGATYVTGSTLLPHNLGLAAARDPALVRRAAQITARESRAAGLRWNFAPVVDLGRQPLWARFAETYGEDPLLAAGLGVAAIDGYEGPGRIGPDGMAACVKHFIGYGVPASGKDRSPASIPEIQLRELHLPPFAASVRAGVSAIMLNSGEVNGVPVHADRRLLQDILRGELGFEGVIVSDWEDIIRLHTRHRVAATPKEAVRLAVLAGVDLSMVPNDYTFPLLLRELVLEKQVPLARIDEAVRRILTLKGRLGLFAQPLPEPGATAQVGGPEHQAAALTLAAESLTLLKNRDSLLPLGKESRVLVAGPGAENLATLNGAWSYTWQGQDLTRYPARDRTIAQAIRELIGADRVRCASVPAYEDPRNTDTEQLRALASEVDVIVLCLGEDAYAESPGNINDLALDEKQTALALAAVATGKPVILVLTAGRPRLIRPIEPGMGAILFAGWPGAQAGPAIARALFGDDNPSGRLPFTYPQYSGDLVSYDYKPTESHVENFENQQRTRGYEPQYPFGHGLSYTTFAYANLRAPARLVGAEKIVVTVDVTNTGARAGRHAVELYSRDLYASVTPAARRLRAFEKITLAPGETRTVSFALTRDDLAFINAAMQRVTEPGEFELMVGDLRRRLDYAER